MKKIAVFLLLTLLCAGAHADLLTLYKNRLDNSLEYKRALLQFEQGKVSFNQLDRPYIPYVDITGGQAGKTFTIQNDAQETPSVKLNPFSLNLKANFTNVLGADIGITFPFLTWKEDTGASIEIPSLTISRQFFPETAVRRLKTKANLLKAEQNLENARLNVFKDLASDIFNYSYYVEANEIHRTYASVLEKKIEAVKDPTALRTLQRQWYAMRKNVLDSQTSLKELSVFKDDISPDALPALLAELHVFVEDLERLLPDISVKPAPGKDIQGLRLSLEAAERQAAFWFLPYLPNPVLSAGITYNRETQTPDWNVSLGFSISLMDRGERSAEALARKMGAGIAKLELTQAEKSAASLTEGLRNRKEILWMDYRLAELSLEEKSDTLEKTRLLFENGFSSEEDLLLTRLDFLSADLNVKRSKSNYYVFLFEIMRAYGAGIPPKEK